MIVVSRNWKFCSNFGNEWVFCFTAGRLGRRRRPNRLANDGVVYWFARIFVTPVSSTEKMGWSESTAVVLDFSVLLDILGWKKIQDEERKWDGICAQIFFTRFACKHSLRRIFTVHFRVAWVFCNLNYHLAKAHLNARLCESNFIGILIVFRPEIKNLSRIADEDKWRNIKFLVLDAPLMDAPLEKRLEFLRNILFLWKPCILHLQLI